ncbi:MAG: hypothetical protein M1358_07740 [Chloroflexi bacterium]|nr:hypothetical protein [Chloroflexota bacterium]
MQRLDLPTDAAQEEASNIYTLLLIYFLLYAIGCLFISFFRENALVLLALRQAQVIAPGAMTAATLLVVLLNTRQQFRGQGWNTY